MLAPGVASPGISYWLESTIHSLCHSLCPLGLITINLTPCLSDAAARSAGLGEMFTKAMDHQHFDCGTLNCQYSLSPVIPSAFCLHDLHTVVSPSPRTWRANLKTCHFVSVTCAPLPFSTKLVPQPDFFAVFCVPVDGISMWVGFLRYTVFLCLLDTVGCLIISYTRDLTSVPSGVYYHPLITFSI